MVCLLVVISYFDLVEPQILLVVIFVYIESFYTYILFFFATIFTHISSVKFLNSHFIFSLKTLPNKWYQSDHDPNKWYQSQVKKISKPRFGKLKCQVLGSREVREDRLWIVVDEDEGFASPL